jgi:hypothetical protein
MADQLKAPAQPKRIWRIVLVVSLALNLAVAGVVGGTLISGRAGDGPPRSFDLGISPIARALSPEERREVTSSLRRDRVMRGADLRGRADAIVTALKAEPYDPDVMRGLLQEQAAQVATVQGKAQDAFLDAITQMTPERRADFADQLENELSKERPRRGPRQSGG